MPTAIETVDAPSPEEFRSRYLHRNKPVILTGIVDQWPAFTKWSPEYFKTKAGDTEVQVGYDEHGNFTEWYLNPKQRSYKTMAFCDLVEALAGDARARELYMTEYDLGPISPELLEDVDFSDYFDLEKQPARYQPMLFLGRDTCMPLHYHGIMEALLAQITGTKTIWLWEPGQYRLLYPGAWYEPRPLFSRINGRDIFADTWDRKRFPLFSRAEPIRLELRSGQMLFIPVHWWHLTGVDGYQVSVSHFFSSELRSWTFPRPGLDVIARQIKLAIEIRAKRLLGRST